MASPIERFKDAYKNWRYNPFTGADMAVDKEEDNLYIPSSSPFHIQLQEQPRKDDPTTVTVYCYDDVAYFTEVATAPAQGEFRVDYPPADGEGTAQIEFNQNDAGKKVKINYKGTGSTMLAEYLDTKVSYPLGSPADHQILGFVSGAPEWRYNPVPYFHSNNVIYHPSGEDESCLLFRFKRSTKHATVILELKGAKLHQGYYTELKEHLHASGTLAGSQPTHTHGITGSTVGTNLGSHNHEKGSLATGNQSQNHTHDMGEHQHGGVASGANFTWIKDMGNTGGVSQDHNHPMSGSTADTNLGSHDHSISLTSAPGGDDAVTISGSTANTGVTPKTYPDQLKIYINDVDKTTEVLAKTGLTQFGDGTGSHAFVTTGSGEMDISDLITTAGFHEIKITEPTADKGGRCLLHLEVY